MNWATGITARVVGRGAAPPPLLNNFGQNAYASGKSSWDKLVLESGLSNTAKGSNLKSYNGSAAANLPIAGNF